MLYRANALEFAGINQPAGVPNVQKQLMGHAVDFDNLDEMGKPSIVYSWNRNIHMKDFATKQNYVEPVYEPWLSSKEVLRISEAQHLTKAYKDGLDYIKAEKDYRLQLDDEAILVEIRGLPIPDGNGVVPTYDAQTTAMTGLMFAAPYGRVEAIPQQSNALSRSGGLVVATSETEIRQDPITGLSTVSHGVGSTTPLDPMIYAQDDPPMPGLFPENFPNSPLTSSPESPVSVTVPMDVLETPPPSVVASTRSNPGQVYDILKDNMFDTRMTVVPGKTPFKFAGGRMLRTPGTVRPGVPINMSTPPVAGVKRKGDPLPRMNKQRVKLDHPQVLDEVVPENGILTSSSVSSGIAQRMGQGTSVTLATSYPTATGKINTTLIPSGGVEKVVDSSTKRRQTRNVNYDFMPGSFMPPPQPTAVPVGSGLLELRPIASLRGKKEVDSAIRREPLPYVGTEPTVSLRKKRGTDIVEPARKKYKTYNIGLEAVSQ
ncbi:hypothetical protein BC832DRAFT_539129 [Gaertneriomyces semiglobifer]|nr:hypothetical protein BC832DRAFT_539129 [Gaertneriomyces semiglobifer]